MKKFLKTPLKVLLYVFLGAWTLFFVIGIGGSYKYYNTASLVVILLVAVCPFLIIAGIKFGKRRDRKQKTDFEQKYNQTMPVSPDPTASSAIEEHFEPSAPPVEKCIEPAASPVQKEESPEPVVAYIENNGVIMRTDGKEIEDSEIPHLIRMSYDAATKQNSSNISQSTQMRINDSLRIMQDCIDILQTTTNFETFFSRLNLFMDKAHYLSDLSDSGYPGIATGVRQTIPEFLDKQVLFKTVFLENATNKEIQSALQLKTPKGRSNRLLKFLNKLKEYQSSFSDVSEEHIAAMVQVTNLIAEESFSK